MKHFFHWMKRSKHSHSALSLDGEVRCSAPIGLNSLDISPLIGWRSKKRFSHWMKSLNVVPHFHSSLAGEVRSATLIGQTKHWCTINCHWLEKLEAILYLDETTRTFSALSPLIGWWCDKALLLLDEINDVTHPLCLLRIRRRRFRDFFT